MKAKYVSSDKFSTFENNPPETIYEVFHSKSDSACYEVYLFGEYLGGWYKNRFKIIPESTLEQQLQTAKNKVAEIEAQIEAQKPKIGQKYRHCNTDIYLLCRVGGFCLVKIERNAGRDTVGETYGRIYSNIEDVFSGHEKSFTLLP